ncbi:NDP-hexose 2,3-dehydratase family protein [Micromonospora vinacea]|uniref:NDP-hexose 2,3-dehydratase family protein n=1 Tax=Micromonospora vinacea TaxID=709878 RepID=UPI00344FC00D
MSAPGAALRLRPRTDDGLAQRLARSAAETEAGAAIRTTDVPGWLAERARAQRFRVTPIPFQELDGWGFAPGTGNLVHHSGRFFTVEGLHVRTGGSPHLEWWQPIINQPEVGILGIVATEFDGVLHFLLQAKAEPGNPTPVQLSPTVQATRSNYTGAHRGAPVRHLELFTDPHRGRPLTDVLQSEHGSWFHHKTNRNMIVETGAPIDAGADFCWLTLGQIGRLMQVDNLINMDTRTVLACAPVAFDDAVARHDDTEVRSWFTAERTRHDLHGRLVPLRGLPGWTTGDRTIEHVPPRYFRVMAVSVEADNREVRGWTQPLFEPLERGLIAFLTRRFGGVPHLLTHARVEAGFHNTVELGPTVQCTPGHHGSGTGPAFLDLIRSAAPGQIRYDVVHAEEGGRFYHAENRCVVVESDAAPADPPPGYRWLTPGQLTELLRHGHYVNVQARTLLSAITTGAVVL